MPLSQGRAPVDTQFAGSDRIAVIDIGSNSIRLVVYDRLSRAPIPLFNEKVLCGLGRSIERTGRLNPEGVDLALANLARFRRLVEGMQVARADVLATAAVREADDGGDFVGEVARRTGFSVRVLTGEEEARLAAMGVLSGTPGADGLVGDLGGGSLELVGVDQGVIEQQATLPLGPFRLSDATEGRLSQAIKTIDQHLAGLPWISGAKGRSFHTVGGNWRALARLHMEQEGHAVHVIHDYTVDADNLRSFAELVARQSRSSLERMAAVSRRRLETLPAAALVLERLLLAARPAKVVFSAYGLREGHLFDLLPPEERRRDPLLAHCADVAQRLGRFGQAELLAHWTAGLFVGEDAVGARLRQAACLLSDLGWTEHPDYRAEHAYLRILRMPFAGCDLAGRAFLALSIFLRYGGEVDDPVVADGRDLMSAGALAKAQVLGSALRLAHALSGGAVGLLQRTALRLGDETLSLVLPEDAAVLSGEAVQRRLEALGKLLNRRTEIAVQSGPRLAG